MINVELKASDPDPARTLALALAAGADDRGMIEQRDTYFAAPRGLLKLREQDPGADELIGYERAIEPRQRTSTYQRTEVADAEALRTTLEAALGVTETVVKRRRLLLWEQTVRIHLDEVDELGTFVEIEAVAPPGSDLAHEHEQVARLREILAIGDERVCAEGYRALLSATRRRALGASCASGCLRVPRR